LFHSTPAPLGWTYPTKFDVTWHATNPSTDVYGMEYFSCHT
jgi:hypothetical protein